MDQKQAKDSIAKLQSVCSDIYDVAKTANRNKKSLSGDNSYGNRFHMFEVEITKLEKRIQPVLDLLPSDDADIKSFESALQTLKSTSVKPPKKAEALRQLKKFCETKLLLVIENMTANPIPITEQVISLELFKDGRLRKLALQINGCYEHQWYDACAVMMRRLSEILIIESYIKQGKADEIKDGNQDFLMLRDLVEIMKNDNSWNLGRDTKPGLSKIKRLGDLSAHNRHFMATKKAIDEVIEYFTEVIPVLLHHAGYNAI